MMASNNRFQRIFWITAGVHAALILTLLFYSGIRRWFFRPPPPEDVTFVTLHTPTPPAETVVETPPAPAPPPPPEPAPRPRVERSTQRVRRDVPPPEPTPPRLTPEQIRQRLQQAVPAENAAAPSGVQDNLAWYYSLIHQTLYQAWEQPGSVLPGTTATARIRVMRDGSVTRRELARESGNSAMDNSVMRALESVQRLSPLPAEIQGAHHDFTIEFELTGAQR